MKSYRLRKYKPVWKQVQRSTCTDAFDEELKLVNLLLSIRANLKALTPDRLWTDASTYTILILKSPHSRQNRQQVVASGAQYCSPEAVEAEQCGYARTG